MIKYRKSTNVSLAPIWCRYIEQEAQLLLTNRAMLFCKVVEVLQDFLWEYVDKKLATDYN